MSIFAIIILALPVLSILWWVWANHQFTKLDVDCAWKLALGIGMSCILSGFVWVVLNRYGWLSDPIPAKLNALILLWGILILPLLALPLMVGGSVVSAARKIFSKRPQQDAKSPLPTAAPCSLNRRKLLCSLAVMAPVVATFGTAAIGLKQIRHFRIRKLTVHLQDLPAALDGLTIAHLSDTHVGKFTRGKLLFRLSDAINQLKPDLTLITGDLIDYQVGDLPEAIEMLQRIKPRSGIFIIEGNHDIIDEKERFYREIRASGVPFLRDEARTIRVRGVAIQILGLRWNRHDDGNDQAVEEIVKLRDPAAFQILLAHHPHAFDRAAQHEIPLTLAGHTHGGQLMLSDNLGVGSVMFRYWSGLYRKGKSALVVSNGAGNWFPLRVHAPAEIIHLTLKRAVV